MLTPPRGTYVVLRDGTADVLVLYRLSVPVTLEHTDAFQAM